MKQLFKGNAVFTFNDHEIEVEFTSISAKPFNRVKPSLESIINLGRERIIKSVEGVIVKHEAQIKEEQEVKCEFRFDGFIDNENRRMKALSGGHDRHLNLLLMAQNASNGVNYGAGLQGQESGRPALSGAAWGLL